MQVRCACLSGTCASAFAWWGALVVPAWQKTNHPFSSAIFSSELQSTLRFTPVDLAWTGVDTGLIGSDPIQACEMGHCSAREAVTQVFDSFFIQFFEETA